MEFYIELNRDISNNNLKGNNVVYGQLPGCISELKNLLELDISNNKFRGRIPYINSEIKKCKIINNNLCLFHNDSIPKVCLDYVGSKQVEIKNNEYKVGNLVYFKLCENIFVDKDQFVTSKIFNDKNNTNTSLRILIFSSSFPLCSLIITTIVTIFGRVKSKFNKKDPNMTNFSASISHLPNNFGNISNTNRHSLLTRYDSYNRPAPRPDNENSFTTLDQKRISSNPSTSLANTSLSSNTPSSPVISPNEIKNSNYRVIGSHYSLQMNNAQAIRFKNSLSMIQNNRNSLTNGTDPHNALTNNGIINEKLDSTNMNSTSIPAINQNENQNRIINSSNNISENKNNGNSTPSKARESLDLLLSSPQAMYFQSNRRLSPSLNKQSVPKVMSPIQPPKAYPPMSGKVSPKSPNLNKSPLMNSINFSTPKIQNSPSMSIPQYMPSPNVLPAQSAKIINPSILKMNSPVTNLQSPNSVKRPRVRRVVYSFIPDLPDELHLIPGEEVIIHKVFDDGYAYGENASNGQFGVFPISSLHPDDQDISPEEKESSPSLSDIQLSQLNIGKSPKPMSPIINNSSPVSKFNNIKVQDLAPKLMVNKENISNNITNEQFTKQVNMNNLYPLNLGQGINSQNSNSQNSNSQNSLTDEDDIDTLRRQSKIGYSAYMDQQKQKLMKRQAKQQARKNKMNSFSENNYFKNEQNSYNEPLSPTSFMPQNMILNENINNRMFGESQASQPSQHSQYSQHTQHSQLSQYSQHSINDMENSSSTSPISPKYKNLSILNGIKSESPSSLEIQRMEDRRHKQIKLLNERLSKKDIGPEERRYYLQLLQQLTN